VGVELTLFRGQGVPGRRQPVVTVSVNGLMPLMAREVVKRGLTGGLKVGELRLGSGILRIEDGRRKWPGAARIGDSATTLGATGKSRRG
jgi:hypothetical protein